MRVDMDKQRKSVIDRFIALSDAEKNRVVAEIEAESPARRLARSRPSNAGEREQWRKFKRKVGRPRIGKGTGTTNISISLERELLKRADALAKREGVSRSELIARVVRAVVDSAA